MLGDTGEGDASQYAVVPPLLAAAGDTDLMLVASDVVYPAGAKAEYAAKFLHPYRDYGGPIYAVPGNHAEHEADPPVEDDVGVPLRP